MTKINLIKNIFNMFPESMTISGEKKISHLKWLGEKISTPENRLIMGVTALASQPCIDYYNGDVDSDTRKVSCARTAAKIIAGTITGVTIRYASIALIKRLSRLPQNGKTLKPIEKLFTPKSADADLINSSRVEETMYNDYRKTLGTGLGLLVMMYTNFALDVPLTRYFTKLFLNRGQKSDKGGSK